MLAEKAKVATGRLRKVFFIFDRENKLFFAGVSNGKDTWAKTIEAAHPFDHQGEADDEYERLKALGLDVMVEG